MSDRIVNIVVGLGNPEQEYNGTRHNVGFDVLDALAPGKWIKGGRELYCINPECRGLLIKPTTGMNTSGLAVKDACNASNCEGFNLIVVYDDMDFEPGIVRIKSGGGDGKHNGVKSIISMVGGDFIRVRVGIGKPRNKSGIDWVLGRFTRSERKAIDEAINTAANAVSSIIKDGLQQAMNFYNRKQK